MKYQEYELKEMAREVLRAKSRDRTKYLDFINRVALKSGLTFQEVETKTFCMAIGISWQ